MILARIQDVKNRIELAARKAGRTPSQITLLAVSKGQSVEKIGEAIEAGLRDFGENYAQEMLEHLRAIEGRFPSKVSDEIEKQPMGGTGWRAGSPPAINAHFIGHLQRNKVKSILPHVTLIHSVDSLDLAKEIDKRAATLQKTQAILIETNLSGESSKTGIAPFQIEPLVEAMNELDHLQLIGLMTMPPLSEDPEKSRPYFRRLREILEDINRKKLYKDALRELSMGMTHDFEVAIEEGATIVRVGTGIFGERQ